MLPVKNHKSLLIPRKVREANFIKKEPKPTLNRDGGRELSKIYDSLLATPSVRTPPTSRSRGSSVSQHSATNRWWRSRVTLKYSETKCECWRSVLIYFSFLTPTHINLFIRNMFAVLLNDHSTYFQRIICTSGFQESSARISLFLKYGGHRRRGHVCESKDYI